MAKVTNEQLERLCAYFIANASMDTGHDVELSDVTTDFELDGYSLSNIQEVIRNFAWSKDNV